MFFDDILGQEPAVNTFKRILSSNRLSHAYIFAGPSGVGKNTLGDFLLREFPELSYSVSATTRPIRSGEEDGKDDQ